MPHSALSRAAAALVAAGVGGGARRCDAHRADRCGCRRRRPHVRQHVLARGQQRPVPRPGRARRQGRRRHDGAARPVGCSATACPRPTRRRTPSSPRRPIKPHVDRRRQHPDPLRPGRADGRLRPARRAQHLGRSSPTPTPAPATGSPARRRHGRRRARPTSTSTTLQPGLYGYCTTDQQKQTGPGRYDVWAYCVRRQRLRRLPDQHADGEPPGDRGARVLPRHPVRLRLRSTTAGPWRPPRPGSRTRSSTASTTTCQYLNDSPITDRKRSIDKFGGLFHYGVWIFFRYLTEQFPAETGGLPTIVRKFWEGADSSKGAKKDQYFTQAMASVLKKKPYKLSIDKAFALFSDANRRASTRLRGGHVQHGQHTRTPRSTARRASTRARSKTFKATLDHLTARDLPVHAEGQRQASCKLSISGRRRHRAPGRS